MQVAPSTRLAQERYAAFVRAAGDGVVGLDFDGTLAPIVDDPASARIHPDARDVLVALAGEVRAVAVVTGRPARQVLDLGGLEDVGTAVADAGCELFVFGQYGNERWSTSRPRIVSPRPPRGLAAFERELPGVLREAGASSAYVEDKGLAVAVHTRRLPDPQAGFDALLAPLRDLASRHDLALEPGRHVIEVRAPGMHKGVAVRTLVEELSARAFLFAGDDLGDVEAFEALDELAGEGLATLRVCSASGEQPALEDRADLVVAGPGGVLELLGRLVADVRARG